MSRSGYTEDYEHIELYRTAVARALYGKRGQAFIRKLKDALEAMPQKLLIESDLVSPDGCCAIGAVAMHCGIDVSKVDPEDPDAVGRMFNIAPSMAAEISWENDENASGNPWDRYEHMLRWVNRNLREGGQDADR